jgi:hypothetical protein
MTPEQIAQRHQYRTGYRLVDYAEVGLPVYLLTVRASTLAHKRISPIEEFVLKAVDIGLQTAGEVASFLGLQERVVKGTLTELALADSINLAAKPGSRTQFLRLTQKGKKSLELAETVEPEERNFQIYFDGIIRNVAWYGNVHLLRYREMNDLGLFEIPATQQRRPQVEDLRIQDIQNIVRSRAGVSDYKRDLLTIKTIDRCERMFLSAVALIFKSEVGREVQVGFAVDGKLSPNHERAFAQAGGPQKLRIEEQLMKSSQEREEVLALHKEAATEVPATNDIGQLEKARSQAQQEIGKLEEQLDQSESEGERQIVESRLVTVREQYTRSQTELDSIGVRFLYVHEHPALLQDALENSTSRLAINSPWIKRAVVNADFMKKLERLLQKGVRVYIAWGVGDESEEKSDKSALEALQRLMLRYETFWISRLGDTHAKVLVSDRKYAIVTSFNWLSFRGDPNRTFRDEQGTMVRIPELIDQKFDYLLSRLEAEKE